MSNQNFEHYMCALTNQNKEFDAVGQLVKAYKQVSITPPVDDNYPEIRHYYESAVNQLIDAFKQNGRI